MNERVLIVDDDSEILKSFRRHLYRDFDLETAMNGTEALMMLKDRAYCVVVSDYMMPQMNGIRFLAQVKENAPNTVRIMLTGYANVFNAIEAVNEGHVFRFLTKPCSPEALAKAIQAGIEYHYLLTAERVLLEQTLNSSLGLMVEVLGLTNPNAFSRAVRLKKIVGELVRNLGIRPAWMYELAASLSQTGLVAVPPYILEKIYSNQPLSEEEWGIYNQHPHTARLLIEKIPRMEKIAQMIEGQNRPFLSYLNNTGHLALNEPVIMGSQILKIAIDYDVLASHGYNSAEIIKILAERGGVYNGQLLLGLNPDRLNGERVAIKVSDVRIGMVAAEDIFTSDSLLLLQAGMEITETGLIRLVNIHANGRLREPIFVLPTSKEEKQPESPA